jgi:hypothetical protein
VALQTNSESLTQGEDCTVYLLLHVCLSFYLVWTRASGGVDMVRSDLKRLKYVAHTIATISARISGGKWAIGIIGGIYCFRARQWYRLWSYTHRDDQPLVYQFDTNLIQPALKTTWTTVNKILKKGSKRFLWPTTTTLRYLSFMCWGEHRSYEIFEGREKFQLSLS